MVEGFKCLWKKTSCLQAQMYVIKFESVVNWKENEGECPNLSHVNINHFWWTPDWAVLPQANISHFKVAINLSFGNKLNQDETYHESKGTGAKSEPSLHDSRDICNLEFIFLWVHTSWTVPEIQRLPNFALQLRLCHGSWTKSNTELQEIHKSQCNVCTCFSSQH